ncbi:MAG: adenylate/guanylate cyclase domain-containing protein [Pseudomonadota bacterium]
MFTSDTKRRISAVLSADVVGYSRLMGDDESHTVALLNESRLIFSNFISDHQGRLVDTAGDSILAVFDSVVEAVLAAINIQTELQAKNIEFAEEKRMAFRIGINIGDIIEQDDGTVYGDGVNVAARIESLAESGGIAVSRLVFEFIEGKVNAEMQFVGEHSVKNIDRPISVYAVRPPGLVSSGSNEEISQPIATLANQRTDRPSIAVLPFTNMSQDPEEAYFADGISEDIITELARFQELDVIARNSTFTYKGTPVKVQDVGRDLGARYVLEGSVRKAGNRVRVTAQLVEAETGHHLWAERYDRNLDDVFAVQDELTGKIVAVLMGRLTDSERRRVHNEERTENLQAYDLVLRGREYWMNFTQECNLKARELYLKAIELDPQYARAYASLSWTYLVSYDENWSDEPYADLEKALELARQGVTINSSSHSNHLVLARAYYYKKFLDRAAESCETAISLNPNDPDTFIFYGAVLSHKAEHDKALEQMAHAFSLNPNLGQWHRGVYTVIYFNARRYDDAITAWRAVDDPAIMFYRWAAATFAMTGNLDKARYYSERYLERHPQFDFDEHVRRMPFKLKEDAEHYAEALRRAGFAEMVT